MGGNQLRTGLVIALSIVGVCCFLSSQSGLPSRPNFGRAARSGHTFQYKQVENVRAAVREGAEAQKSALSDDRCQTLYVPPRKKWGLFEAW